MCIPPVLLASPLWPFLLLLPYTLLLVLPAAPAAAATTGVTRPTIILTRGADPNSLTSTLDPAVFGEHDDATLNGTHACTYDGGMIALSHPMSLKPSDKFFSTGQLQLNAIEMMVDEINTSPRCGVAVGGRRHGLTLTTYGDDSSKAKVGAIVQNGMMAGLGLSTSTSATTAPRATYWLGPYSSGLTGIMSPLANATQSVLVAGGAASTPVFRDNPTVFGTFPPTKNYLAQAVKALAEAGARTVASVWEDASFTRGVCSALPDLVELHGMSLQSETEVPSGPTAEDDLDHVASTLSAAENDPDVVVTCVYAAGCAEWVSSLRKSGWSPRAQVFTVCVGMDSFVDAVGTDAEYMMGISPWDSSLPGRDGLVGWSAAEFAELFTETTARTATYHAASAAASVGVLVQAMERADSLDPREVSAVLSTGEFTTLYGTIVFNADGQSEAPALVLQYDEDVTVQTVYPPEQKSAGDMVYPMPTWDHRDCMTVSPCQVGGSGYAGAGTCRADGTCECPGEAEVSVGVGADASCVLIPDEDMTYVSSALTAVGIALVVIQGLLSLGAAIWTAYFRSRSVVKASQPEFLLLICLGTFLIAAGIIPIGIQGTYRYEQDPLTGEVTDVPNDDIRRADAACMATPWLFSLGFVIVFSALFAKIWRVKMVFEGSQRFVRRKVTFRDVAMIMVVLLAITIVILLTWQLVDPLRWDRAVITTDGGGYPTKSVGTCQSNNASHFLIPLLIFDGGCLICALYLCYATRKVSSNYSEGKWITASIVSIFQILILAMPILVIVENDNNAFYFVRTAIMFLMSTTVTLFIFLPKAYKLHFKPDSSGNRAIQFNAKRETSASAGKLSQNGSENGSAISDMRSRVAARRHSETFNRQSFTGINDVSVAEQHSECLDKSSVEERRSSYDGSVTFPRRASMPNLASMASMASMEEERRFSIDSLGAMPRRPSVTFAANLEDWGEKDALSTDDETKEQTLEEEKTKKDEAEKMEEEEEKKGDDFGVVL